MQIYAWRGSINNHCLSTLLVHVEKTRMLYYIYTCISTYITSIHIYRPLLLFISPPQQDHTSKAPDSAVASARTAPVKGIFDGLHSITVDLVDLLTRNGTFAFLQDLHETGRLWDLLNFRISQLVSVAWQSGMTISWTSDWDNPDSVHTLYAVST
jgi:hypothetical protein